MDVTIPREGLQNLGLRSVGTTFEPRGTFNRAIPAKSWDLGLHGLSRPIL